MEDNALVDLALAARRSVTGLQDASTVDTADEQWRGLAYALGWLVASAIVRARFDDSGMDALPVHHPGNGWDRFVLTRRVSSRSFAHEAADRFGLIMLTGPDAPRLTRPSGAQVLALGASLQADAEAALAGVAELFPCRGVVDERDRGWRQRQRVYPRLYRAIAELIAEHPGMMAAREIFIDTESIDGAHHPLYLHGVSSEPVFTYDWILIQYGDRSAFLRTHGGRAIYETDRGGWSTVKQPLTEMTLEGMKTRMRAWLRISGVPDHRVD